MTALRPLDALPAAALPPHRSPVPSPVYSSPAPQTGTMTLPSGPLNVVYYQTWTAKWAGSGADMDLAKLPGAHRWLTARMSALGEI